MFYRIICLTFLCSYYVTLLLSCQASDNVEMKEHTYSREKSKDSAIFTMIGEPLYKFGDIKHGDKVTYAFHFKNSGRSPLIISKVNASCGCTVAKYPKAPIQVNKEDSIIAYYDSSTSGKGFQNKVITVFSNSPNSPYLLTLIGNVH